MTDIDEGADLAPVRAAKITSTEEAFQTLVDPDHGHWVANLLAFAIYEQGRMEWLEEQLELGATMGPELVRSSYEAQTRGKAGRSHDEANIALEDLAGEAAQLALDQARDDLLTGVVVEKIETLRTELEAAGRKAARREWWVGIATGVIGSLVFGAILALITLVALADPSVLKAYQAVTGTLESSTNDK